MSIKLKFRPSTVNGREGVLYFQIIHERCVKRVNTSHHVLSDEWDDSSEQIIIPESGSPRRERLVAIMSDVEWEMKRFAEIEKSFDERRHTVDELADAFVDGRNCNGLFGYMRKQVERLKKLNRVRCGETMGWTLRSFMKFRGGVDVGLDGLTKDVVEQYEAWLRARGVKRNTSSFYMRNLRAAYRAAVDEGLTADGNPFRRVYTGVDKTVNRAISLEQIRRILRLDLSKRPALEFARDLLMFSFYMRGMSFVDMAFCGKRTCRAGASFTEGRRPGRN